MPASLEHDAAAFLQQASPFAALDAVRCRALATRLQRRTVPSGAVVIRQGEPGDACYLIHRGRVEVVADDGSAQARQLATLEAGALFGEAALLTQSPRNATVRTLEACELLILHRADLLAVMGSHPEVTRRMIELLRLRDRPRRTSGIIVQERISADGAAVAILKDPQRGTYYQLSVEGRFIWDQLDGEHTLRDVTLAYFVRFQAFAPHMIAEVIAGLAAAGFVVGSAVRSDVAALGPASPWWQRAILAVRRGVEWRIVLDRVDPFFARWYRRGVRWIYTWPSQCALLAVTIGGIAAFIALSDRVDIAQATIHGSAVIWWLVPALCVSIVVHELGHAFTVKACGRDVSGIGLGWYWFSPIAFVDTSDMWLADRRSRMAVTIAGPYANCILAGGTACIGWWSSDPLIMTVCWLFALGSYALVCFNANPLLEYDGYYCLMDFLDRPNLRRHCLAWLWKGLPAALRDPRKLRGHWLECCYGIASVGYVLGVCVGGLWLAQKFLLAIIPSPL